MPSLVSTERSYEDEKVLQAVAGRIVAWRIVTSYIVAGCVVVGCIVPGHIEAEPIVRMVPHC